MFSESLPLLNYPDGVIGPPWRVVKQLSADTLALDPPRFHNCHALAVFSPSSRLLVRCRNQDDIDKRSTYIAQALGGEVIVLKGAIQLSSGIWYWPFVTQRVLIGKALDPLKSVDRAKIANKLQKSLLNAGRGAEADYLDEALDMLDVDWQSMSSDQIDAVVAETRLAASMIADNVGVKAATTSAGVTLISTGELSRRAPVLGITEHFARPDRIAVRRIASQMPFFITGDYARRAGAWEERDARAIIARGLRRGLEEREIAKALHTALAQRVTGRSEQYYRMLANVSVGRASSYGQLTGYRDADIRAFEWEAVMDGATCFEAGTKVETPSGDKNIEEIKPGDFVIAGSGKARRVEATRVKQSKNWVNVVLSTGIRLVVTSDHLFRTKRGWVGAGNLSDGEELETTYTNMSNLRNSRYGAQQVLSGTPIRGISVRGVQQDILNAAYLGGSCENISLFSKVPYQFIVSCMRKMWKTIQAETRRFAPLFGGLPTSAVYCNVPHVWAEKAEAAEPSTLRTILLAELLSEVLWRDKTGSASAEAIGEIRRGFSTRSKLAAILSRFFSLRPLSYRNRWGILAQKNTATGRAPRQSTTQRRFCGEENSGNKTAQTTKNSERSGERIFVERVLDATKIWKPSYDLQVADEHTFKVSGVVVHNCNVCRFLHGTRFYVQDAIDQFTRAQANADPERGLMEEQPWYREADGKIHVAPAERGGKLGPLIATIVRSAVGREDQRGTFRTALSAGSSGATQTPPAHGLCRCITVPVE